MVSGFFEDDWKVTPKLTLNLGLRYDFATPAMEGKNRMADFDPDSGSLVFARKRSPIALARRSQLHEFRTPLRLCFLARSEDRGTGGYGIYYTLFERYRQRRRAGSEPALPYQQGTVRSLHLDDPGPDSQPGFPANFPTLPPSTSRTSPRSTFARWIPTIRRPMCNSGASAFNATSVTPGSRRSTMSAPSRRTSTFSATTISHSFQGTGRDDVTAPESPPHRSVRQLRPD